MLFNLMSTLDLLTIAHQLFFFTVYTNSLLATLNARKMVRPISTVGNRTVDTPLSLRDMPKSPIPVQVKNIHTYIPHDFPFEFFYVCRFFSSVQIYPSRLIPSKNCMEKKVMMNVTGWVYLPSITVTPLMTWFLYKILGRVRLICSNNSSNCYYL